MTLYRKLSSYDKREFVSELQKVIDKELKETLEQHNKLHKYRISSNEETFRKIHEKLELKINALRFYSEMCGRENSS